MSAKLKTLKANKLKKKKQFAKPLVIKNAKGKVFVTKLKKGTTSDIYKKVTVKKNGLITIKKGKYLRKTYKINLKITELNKNRRKNRSGDKVNKSSYLPTAVFNGYQNIFPAYCLCGILLKS